MDKPTPTDSHLIEERTDRTALAVSLTISLGAGLLAFLAILAFVAPIRSAYCIHNQTAEEVKARRSIFGGEWTYTDKNKVVRHITDRNSDHWTCIEG